MRQAYHMARIVAAAAAIVAAACGVTHAAPQQRGPFPTGRVGEIPVFDATVTPMGGTEQHVTNMVTQQIFFPTSHPDATGAAPASGALGDGFDVIAAAPGQKGYSPLCQVYSFDPLDPMNPETRVADIDMSTAMATGDYVWCIQLAKPVTK